MSTITRYWAKRFRQANGSWKGDVPVRQPSIAVIAAMLILSINPSSGAAAPAATLSTAHPAGPPAGRRSYPELVKLFTDFNAWKSPPAANGIVDYSPAAVAQRRSELKAFQKQLPDFAVASWDRHRQVDYLAVRAQMDQQDFMLNVTKPWARDPGMYVDALQRLAYPDLPLDASALAAFQVRLRAIPAYLIQARTNLDSITGDYADLAIHGLSNGDGVGHGMPYRAVEPAGLIGWFADLKQRASAQQPELVPDIVAAEAAIAGFRDWLVTSRPGISAPSGIGQPAYDWFLTNVRLMPYDSNAITTLAQRELERHWANYTTERHRNRNLPELKLAQSAAEYEAQLAGTDRKIRQWLKDEAIITIPDYIPGTYQEVGFNAP